MNDFDGLFTSDFGLKPQGKSAPMAPKQSSNAASVPLNFDFGSRSSASRRDAKPFDDLLAGAGSDNRRVGSAFDLDSMYGGPPARSANSPPPPVYDKPVYDDDIFDGVPGLKTTSSKVKFDDFFAATSEGGGGAAAFDDLLGGFGNEPKSSGGKRSEKDGKGVSDFDDLLAGFGNSSGRHTPDIGLSSEPTASASKTTSTVAEDPFKVFESASAPVDSPAGHFMDPLDEISKFGSSRSTKNDSSSTSNGKVYEDIDPFDGLGKSVPAFSSEGNSRKGSSSPRLNRGPTAGRVSPSSQFDELDDFAMGRSRDNDNESGDGLPDEELEMNSAAAAMKEAMDRAEAKFRHAKEVREREYSKAARSKEAVHMEKDERTVLEEREKQERLDRERQQKERDEKEQRRLMKEREEKEREQQRDSVFESQFQSDVTRKSTSASTNMKKASSSTNIVDDLSSIFGAAPSSGEFQEVEGESEERRRARLERHQRAQERAQKALAEKNQRDLQTQREQAERNRIGETLDFEIKRWAAGKEGNLRALLSTLQYVLWPECGWQPVSLTDLITAASVKKAYRKATLCIHPDKVQQKGANLQQKYVAEKVFDLLKEAWNKFNSEELF
uniref:UBA domain-containing protein 7 n=1 Tax=Cajanus cajan TaxID=3821 RepID=A0A151R717_CAJCA|nr:UBA domain-containing protein 7 [Cajanus cajan]